MLKQISSQLQGMSLLNSADFFPVYNSTIIVIKFRLRTFHEQLCEKYTLGIHWMFVHKLSQY